MEKSDFSIYLDLLPYEGISKPTGQSCIPPATKVKGIVITD